MRDQDLEDLMGFIVRNKKQGTLVDSHAYDGPGDIPPLKVYIEDASALNVVKVAIALKTRPNYLELLAKLLVGTKAEVSVNGHVGKCLTKINDMTASCTVSRDEMYRLEHIAQQRGTRAIHFDLCKWYLTPEGCRFGDNCICWHADHGAQSLGPSEAWDQRGT